MSQGMGSFTQSFSFKIYKVIKHSQNKPKQKLVILGYLPASYPKFRGLITDTEVPKPADSFFWALEVASYGDGLLETDNERFWFVRSSFFSRIIGASSASELISVTTLDTLYFPTEKSGGTKIPAQPLQ